MRSVLTRFKIQREPVGYLDSSLGANVIVWSLGRRGNDILVHNGPILPEDVVLVGLIASEQQDNAVIGHER